MPGKVVLMLAFGAAVVAQGQQFGHWAVSSLKRDTFDEIRSQC